jgi:NAD+ kinase
MMKGHALNEVVISQGAIARVIELKTAVNGTPLTTFRADGIIIATPTGSTAYNLAAGGPILHPTCRETVITPINAHGLGRRPLVVPSVTEIAVEVLHRGKKFGDVKVSLTLDGQSHHELQSEDRIIITEHPNTVRFLRRKKDTFYEALRTKLRWGED